MGRFTHPAVDLLATSADAAAPALADRETSLAHGELAARAGVLAGALRDAGVRPGELVGLHLGRSVEYVVAIAAVLRAGAAFLPIDPALPEAQRERLRAAAGAGVVLSESPWLGGGKRLSLEAEGEPVEQPLGRPEDLAYGLFTSGSTGVPRCVLIERRNLLALLAGIDSVAPPPARLSGAAICPFGFDVSVWEIFSMLARGGSVRIFDAEARVDGRCFARELVDHGIANAYVPPGMLLDLVETLEGRGDVAGLERILVGVEPIPQSHLQRLRDLDRHLTIVNGYGPTEATICATLFRFEQATDPDARVPIGAAVPGYRVDLVDEDLRRLPSGAVGELLIAGAGVGRGYAGETSDGDDRFLPDPFCERPGARAYRTGDLGRIDADGEIVFVGRRDSQAKVRGFRIELGEVERALTGVAAVRRAVARVLGFGGEPRLVAFAEADAGADPAALTWALTEVLAPHAVPDRVVVCERLPVNANGKVDHRALVALARRRPPGAAAPAPARDATERELLELAGDLLGLDEIGIDDDLRELGLNSLLAMALARRVRESTGRELTASLVLKQATIRGLAAAIPRLELLSATPPAPSGPRLASPAQQGLWALQEMDPDNRAFYLPVALELRGPLDAERVERAMTEIVERHEQLRTRFEDRDGELFQIAARAPRLQRVQATGRPWGEVADELLGAGLADPPPLSAAPWRGWVVRLGSGRQVLALLLHHTIFDGWSLRVLVAELRALLAGEALPPAGSAARLEAQATPSAEARASAEGYWRRRFAEPPRPLELPLDRPRGRRRSSRGGRVVTTLTAACSAGLETIASRTAANRFTVLLALAAVLARRYCGNDDLVLCAPSAQREGIGAERTIGYFVNLLALRLDADGEQTLDTFVARVGAELADARASSSRPFERLAAEMGEAPSLTTSSLTRLVVVEEVDAELPAMAGGIVVDAIPFAAPTAKYELSLTVGGGRGPTTLTWEYASDLFDHETVARIARNFEALIAAATAAGAAASGIAELDALDPAERRRLLVEFNQTEAPAPLDRGLDALFAEQVRRTPDAPAVVGDGETLSYRELDRRADGLARALVETGVGPGDPVLIHLSRSPAQIVAVLATIKAGGTYVPVDPALPAKRLAAMREAAGAQVAVTDDGRSPRLPGGLLRALSPRDSGGAALPEAGRGPDSACYVMFTSGSTGVPKGVAVPDRGVIRLVRGQTFMSPAATDVFMQLSSFSFDAATLEIWGALLNGARLVVPSAAVVRDPELLCRAISRHGITIGFVNVSLFRHLLEESAASLRSFHTLLVGGEAVPQPLVAKATETLEPGAILNGYGPTENTTFSCCHRLAAAPVEGMSIPVGKPIANSTAYVVDARLRPLPIGAIGEIAVGGHGVAIGYVNDPAATARSFVPDPFSARPGARLYRTGDLGRVLPGGALECLGRGDDQVKVRGYRIQLAEVEHLMAAVPGVRRAIALAPEGEAGRRLLGFVEASAPVTPELVRRALVAGAPSYCVPAQIVVCDRFPASANGKVDRRRLLEIRRGEASRGELPAAGPTERRLALIWAELLRLNEVGADQPFFEVGGDSLLLVSLRDRIATELGTPLSIAELLEHPTVRSQAELLDGAGRASAQVDRARARARRRRERGGRAR